MQVNNTLIVDLAGYRLDTIHASQGDSRSRVVRCRLRENGAPWPVPAGCRVQVAYELPDGTPGLYEQLPDGTAAGSIDGDTVTVILHDSILAQAGASQMSVVLRSEDGAQLSTWPIRVMVSGPRLLTEPDQWPQLGGEFAGSLLYGDPAGKVAPLPIGAGLEVRDGRLGVSGIVNLYVCSDGEYTPGGAPVIAAPDESTFYLVPQDSEGTLYASWVYAGGVWEFVETLTVTFDEAEGGKDGVSVTHSWNGTVLSVTSASGTSSADLKGAPGYTPVKGVDYFTPEEVREVAETAAGLVDVPEAIKENKWELIETITLTEDVKAIERTVEPDGTPYNFIKMAVRSVMESGVAASAAVNYRFNNSMGLILTGVAHLNTAKQYSFMYAEVENGRFNGYTGTGKTNQYEPLSITGNSYYRFLFSCDKFTAINLSTPVTNAVFPADSVIEIYGVRA